MQSNVQDIYCPFDAEIIECIQESSDIFTLTIQPTDFQRQQNAHFLPGQFNMVYLFGVGEVAISIVSASSEDGFYSHTIRSVGRVTQGLSLLKKGDHLGIRGPFGRGWPLQEAQSKDILIITGGLGCAPSVSIIDYILKRRGDFGRLIILQGVKHSDDFIFSQYYERWAKVPNTQVKLAATASKPNWPGYTGLVTNLIEQVDIDADHTLCMICGPEGMMLATADQLVQLNLGEETIYLSLERNMECAVGHCGHCQFGGEFICKDGPVFCYSEIKHLLGLRGF